MKLQGITSTIRHILSALAAILLALSQSGIPYFTEAAWIPYANESIAALLFLITGLWSAGEKGIINIPKFNGAKVLPFFVLSFFFMSCSPVSTKEAARTGPTQETEFKVSATDLFKVWKVPIMLYDSVTNVGITIRQESAGISISIRTLTALPKEKFWNSENTKQLGGLLTQGLLIWAANTTKLVETPPPLLNKKPIIHSPKFKIKKDDFLHPFPRGKIIRI